MPTVTVYLVVIKLIVIFTSRANSMYDIKVLYATVLITLGKGTFTFRFIKMTLVALTFDLLNTKVNKGHCPYQC